MAMDTPIEIWRGNNDPPVIWIFEDRYGRPVNLAGSVFRLTILSHGKRTQFDTADAAQLALTLDAEAGRVVWNYTIADGDLIERSAVYELVREIGGTVRTWAGGPINVQSYLYGVSPVGGACGVRLSAPNSAAALNRIETRGPIGPAGPQGQGIQLTQIAAVTLGGHKAVRPVPGGVAPASASDIAQANTIVGITRDAAVAGDPVSLIFSGELEEPTWAWSRGPVYAGENGALTQSPPTAGFVQRLGVALTATKIAVQIGPATIKA